MHVRRNITVYSATLAAFTINHDVSDLSGSDLLLSFHDNDHYNSVRNDSVLQQPSKPRTKQNNNNDDNERDTTIPRATSMSELSMNDGGKGGGRAPPRVKKSAPCPCGSGLKYRKCCSTKARSQSKPQKNREKSEDRLSDNDEETQMKGNFRLLQI